MNGFRFNTKDMVLASLFAALTAVMAQFSFPIPVLPVPVTLQVFAVCLISAIVKTNISVASQLTYILLGLIGLPVFSGFKSGLPVIMGPTGGFLLSFPIMALTIGIIIHKAKKESYFTYLFSMLTALFVCYSIGILRMAYVLEMPFLKALATGIGWYLPLDAIKIALAAFIAVRIRSTLTKALSVN